MKLVLGMMAGLSPGEFVLDGDPVPFPKRGGAPPQFSAHFYCDQTAACIKMPLDIELGLGTDPQFSAHICCGQMAAWIKMSFGMAVGLDLGDFVLDGDPVAPSSKWGRTPNIFGPCLL